MAISDETIESLRGIARRGRALGQHAVVEPDLHDQLLDELPTREKYARALSASVILRAKLQRIRARRAALSPWRRAVIRVIAPMLHDELRTILSSTR